MWMSISGLALGAILTACDQLPLDVSKAKLGTVKLSIRRTATNPVNKMASPQGSGVVITSARVVIEKIKFDSPLADSLDFRLRQAFVQDLNTLDTLYVIENIPVPFGTYKEMEIEIDDLEPEDGQAYIDNPELQGLSIRVTGYVHGDTTQPFVFTSDLSGEQEREFNPPLVLDENSPSTNVVLMIDMARWFVDASGNPVDPRDAANRELIENNIKASIDVYEDEDDDGERDDHDGEDDDGNNS
jgi:hypothetical protein